MIRLKDGIALIDAYLATKQVDPSPWKDVLWREGGGSGADWVVRTVEDALLAPGTNPGRWYTSGQTDEDWYRHPYFLYSTLFAAKNVSKGTYDLVGTACAGATVYDIGGSFFSAQRMLDRGAGAVHVVNLPGPQTGFIPFAAKHTGQRIDVVEDLPDHPARVVCSEYLEHFKEPLVELDRILSFSPVQVYEASSFCVPAYGHHIPLTFDGTVTSDHREANRLWKAAVKNRGLEREKLPGFNSRVWRLI